MSYYPPNVPSSYSINNIGLTIYNMMCELKPNRVIEFGVLHGYSLMCIAQALRDIGSGYVIGYDLWDDYPYNHGNMNDVQQLISKTDMQQNVVLRKEDYFKWIRQHESFDLLHLDISNDGDILIRTVEMLNEELEKGSILLFEGGIPERDKTAWMTTYHKKPIFPLKDRIGYKIIEYRFPGLSIIDRQNKLGNICIDSII